VQNRQEEVDSMHKFVLKKTSRDVELGRRTLLSLAVMFSVTSFIYESSYLR